MKLLPLGEDSLEFSEQGEYAAIVSAINTLWAAVFPQVAAEVKQDDAAEEVSPDV